METLVGVALGVALCLCGYAILRKTRRVQYEEGPSEVREQAAEVVTEAIDSANDEANQGDGLADYHLVAMEYLRRKRG